MENERPFLRLITIIKSKMQTRQFFLLRSIHYCLYHII